MRQQGRKFREILPAGHSPDGPPLTAQPGPNSSRDLPPRKKKKHSNVRSSCEGCRARKSACDNQRPQCSACRRRNQQCTYPPDETTPKVAASSAVPGDESADFFHLLMTLPQNESVDLLLQLRAGGDITVPSSFGPHARPPPKLTIPASDLSTSLQNALPPSQQSTEFELMTRHPISYPTLVPVEAAYLDLASLLQPSRLPVGLGSFPPASASPLDPESSDDDSDPTLRVDASHLGGSSRRRTRSQSARSVSYCDNRLNDLDISRWTDVSISSDLAARIISLYLETDHPLLGFFDVDLFLDGLVSREKYFCSRLLVSALLSWACLLYSTFERASAPMSLLFYEEAKEHWAEEMDTNTLTTAAATQFLSLSASSYGKDQEAIQYLCDGISMGKRMGLFGVRLEDSARRWLDDRADWKRAASHTSWGMFCWVTMHCFQFHIGRIEYPPYLPLPGGQEHPLPHYMGSTFPYYCRLGEIVHEFVWEYYNGGGVGAGERASLKFAEKKYGELLAWADALPIDLVRGNQNQHHTVVLHIVFHTLVLALFRPFLREPYSASMRVESLASPEGSPKAIYAASVNQLKRLILVYGKSFPAASYSYLWHTALLYLSNAMLREATIGSTEAESSAEPEWRFYFSLCLARYIALYASYRVAAVIARGLLSMAMRDGVMNVSEVSAIIRRLEEGGTNYSMTDDPKASFILDLDLAVTDPSAAQVDILAERFEEMSIFYEFINPSGESEDGVNEGEDESRMGRRRKDRGLA